MKQTEAQLRASKKYHEKLDNLQIRVPKGAKAKIAEHAAANGEYTSGRSGPCVKKKSRYSIFPSRTRFAAYRYHPSSWFKFPYQTETAASMT